MIDVDKWREILSTLRRHKLRTALTAFGVFWGIFMLTVLLGAGKGFENGVIDGFPPVPNFIYIWNGGKTQIPYQGMPVGRNVGFKPDDVEAIMKNVASVGLVKGQNAVGVWGGSAPFTVHKSKNGAFSVQGGFQGIENINSMKIVEGRSFNSLDERERRKVALIGNRVRDQLFIKGEPVVGANITVNGINFQVIGVYESLQNGNQQQEGERIYLPNETLRKSFNQDWVGSFMILPKAGINAATTEEDVKAYLSKIKKVSPDDRGVFGSFNLQAEFDKVQSLLSNIHMFSWVVAIGTIFAGAIGVGNIMLIVVKERTREIGLRKALGATPGTIIAMIIQESLFITAIAGYAGLVVGVALIEGIAQMLNAQGGTDRSFFSRPEVEFGTALLALGILIVSGLLASLLPAAKAAAVNPILALQDE